MNRGAKFYFGYGLLMIVFSIVFSSWLAAVVGNMQLDPVPLAEEPPAMRLLEGETFKLLLPTDGTVSAVAVPFHTQDGEEEWWIRIAVEGSRVEQELPVQNEEEAHWLLNQIRIMKEMN